MKAETPLFERNATPEEQQPTSTARFAGSDEFLFYDEGLSRDTTQCKETNAVASMEVSPSNFQLCNGRAKEDGDEATEAMIMQSSNGIDSFEDLESFGSFPRVKTREVDLTERRLRCAVSFTIAFLLFIIAGASVALHMVKQDEEGANPYLDFLCRADNVHKSRDARLSCEKVCRSVSCCTMAAEGCVTEETKTDGVCASCAILSSFSDSAVVLGQNLSAHVPKAPSNLNRICSPGSILTEDGKILCSDVCHVARCCHDSTCSHPNCLGYKKCWDANHVEDTDMFVDAVPVAVVVDALVEKRCTRDLISTVDGRLACEDMCRHRSCCYAEGTANCYHESQVWCSEYAPCVFLRESQHLLETLDNQERGPPVDMGIEMGIDITHSTASDNSGINLGGADINDAGDVRGDKDKNETASNTGEEQDKVDAVELGVGVKTGVPHAKNPKSEGMGGSEGFSLTGQSNLSQHQPEKVVPPAQESSNGSATVSIRNACTPHNLETIDGWMECSALCEARHCCSMGSCTDADAGETSYCSEYYICQNLASHANDHTSDATDSLGTKTASQAKQETSATSVPSESQANSSPESSPKISDACSKASLVSIDGWVRCMRICEARECCSENSDDPCHGKGGEDDRFCEGFHLCMESIQSVSKENGFGN